MGTVATIFIMFWILCGFVAGGVWKSKGGEWANGFWLGVLLGYFGLFYVAFAQPQDRYRGNGFSGSPAVDRKTATKDCPRCAEQVKVAAQICRFCGYEFPQKASVESLAPELFEGEDVRERIFHAFGIEWGKTADQRVVYREPDSESWILYDPNHSSLVPPRSHR